MSAWTDFVKKVAKDKGISYKEAMTVASKTYKKAEPKAKVAKKDAKKDDKKVAKKDAKKEDEMAK